MWYSKIQIDLGTKKYSVKNWKIQSADPTRPTKFWQNRDPTRPAGPCDPWTTLTYPPCIIIFTLTTTPRKTITTTYPTKVVPIIIIFNTRNAENASGKYVNSPCQGSRIHSMLKSDLLCVVLLKWRYISIASADTGSRISIGSSVETGSSISIGFVDTGSSVSIGSISTGASVSISSGIAFSILDGEMQIVETFEKIIRSLNQIILVGHFLFHL